MEVGKGTRFAAAFSVRAPEAASDGPGRTKTETVGVLFAHGGSGVSGGRVGGGLRVEGPLRPPWPPVPPVMLAGARASHCGANPSRSPLAGAVCCALTRPRLADLIEGVHDLLGAVRWCENGVQVAVRVGQQHGGRVVD